MLAHAKIETHKRFYTYADYAAWGEDVKRCELINGVIFAMAAPTRAHQHTVLALGAELRSFFKGRTCTPYIAPVDVRLSPKGLDDTVVQPDIIVVCDPKKFSDGKSCQGAPDLVIEVLSKSSSKLDRLTKFKKYEQAGVREYWLVDPVNQTAEVFVLEDGRFVRSDFLDIEDESINSSIFEDMNIKMADIFEEQEPPRQPESNELESSEQP